MYVTLPGNFSLVFWGIVLRVSVRFMGVCRSPIQVSFATS